MTLDVGDWMSSVAPSASDPCGLFVKGDQAVPLKSREVKATVYADAGFADTTEVLSYVCSEDCTATFKFPLPPKSAVYRFKAVMGDHEVVTEVKPKAQAEEEFRLATEQGHGAVLMKQNPTASMFTIEVGNMEAHTECVVEFSYLRLLDAMGTTLEYVHTATWVPPYIGSAGDVAAPGGLEAVAAAEPKFAAKVGYSLTYDVVVRSEVGAIKSVEAVEDGAKVSEEEAGRTTRVLLGTPSQSDASKDFSLIIERHPTKAGAASTMLLQRTPPTTPAGAPAPVKTVGLATFVPTLPKSPAPGTTATTTSADGKEGAAKARVTQIKRELWLVVDCSGSMGGSPIEQARQASLFFVKDLPVGAGIKFNLTVFGSSHASLFGRCEPYNEGSEKKAVEWINARVHADLGGTEILDCMQHIYGTPITAGYERSIIFLTDGGISGSEEERVYQLVSAGAKTARANNPLITAPGRVAGAIKSLFGGGSNIATITPPAPAPVACQPTTTTTTTEGEGEGADDKGTDGGASVHTNTTVLSLGIGHGVHRALLDGMAERSGGVAQYVVDDEAIATKCSYLKKCALADGVLLRPRLVARGAMVRLAPHVLPSRLFLDEPLHVLLEVTQAGGPDATLELTAELPSSSSSGPTKVTFELPLSAPATTTTDSTTTTSTATSGKLIMAPEGRALSVLHAMAYVGALLAGKSPLHVRADGTDISPPPAADVVKDAVVRLAVETHLVTPHTAAVGVLLRRDPLDPTTVSKVDVPLQVPHGRALWGTDKQKEEERMRCGMAPQMQCLAAMPLCYGAPPPPPSAAPFAFSAPGAGAGQLRGRGMPVSGPIMMAKCAAPVKKSSAAGFGGAIANAFGGLFGGGSAMPQAARCAPAAQPNFGAVAATSTFVPFGASPPMAGAGGAGFGAPSAPAAAPEAMDVDLLSYEADEEAAEACVMGAGSSGAAMYDMAPAAAEAEKSAEKKKKMVKKAARKEMAKEKCADAEPAPMEEDESASAGSDDAAASGRQRRSSSPQHEVAMEVKPKGGDKAKPSAASVTESAPPMAPEAALSYLNLHRTTEGYWKATPELWSALLGGSAASAAAHAVHGARPAQLSPASLEARFEDAWATVVVLAFLRKYCGDKKAVWGDMEAKALAWLGGVWPAEGCRSAGATVLAAAKLLPAAAA